MATIPSGSNDVLPTSCPNATVKAKVQTQHRPTWCSHFQGRLASTVSGGPSPPAIEAPANTGLRTFGLIREAVRLAYSLAPVRIFAGEEPIHRLDQSTAKLFSNPAVHLSSKPLQRDGHTT